MTPVPARDSAVMLAILGILAYAASMMTHEALGHGGYCLAMGGHTVMLTAWGERCDLVGLNGSAIAAAGPAVQFAAGLLAWQGLYLLSSHTTRLRYFLWLYMVFNLFVSSGYVAFSGLTDFGDAAVVIAQLDPHLFWRGGLILFGSLAYFLSMRAAAAAFTRLVGTDDGSRRLFRIVWIPYAAAGIFACCAGALNQTMGSLTAVGLAAASSFGAGWGLLRLPDMQRGMASKGTAPTVYLEWSALWTILGALVIVLFLFLIGPGLT